MASYRDVVNDDYGRPIPGVLVYVFNKDGSLASLIGGQANPITTDTLGGFSFNAADAVYSLEFRFAGVTRRLDNVIVGSPPEFQGSTGTSDSAFTTLAAMQAVNPVEYPSPRLAARAGADGGVANGPFNYQVGDFSSRASDTNNVVKLDAVPLTTGALVRQGAQGIAYQGRAPGIVRSTQELLAEGVKSKSDFGAKGDGRRVLKPDGTPDEANFVGTDDTAALKNAFAEASGNGFELLFERGTFLISDTLIGEIASGQQQPRITGRGRSLTEFVQLDKSKDAIRIVGNMPRRDQFSMSGFQVTYPDSWVLGRPTGRAITVENVRDLVVEDVRTFRSFMGFNLVGCLEALLDRAFTYYDVNGMKLERGTYESFPNAINFKDCKIQASLKSGIEVVGGCNLAFSGAPTLENIGVENWDKTKPAYVDPATGQGTFYNPTTRALSPFDPAIGPSSGLILTETGFAGGVGAMVKNLYLEANRDYPVYINHANRPALYRFDGCSFNRFNDIRIINDIVFDCQLGDVQTAPAILDLRGCSFTGFNGYTPSVDKKKVAFTTPNGYGGLTFLDDGVLYGEIEEIPEAPLKSRHPQITVLQVGSVNGSIEPVPYPKGINGLQGVERLATGIYAVHPVSRDVRFMSAQVQVIEGGTAITSTVVRAKTAQRAGESAEAFAARPNDHFLIKLYDAAGVLVDGLFELAASGRN